MEPSFQDQTICLHGPPQLCPLTGVHRLLTLLSPYDPDNELVSPLSILGIK